jgi:transcriptional regulator with XRE-family HTH domain
MAFGEILRNARLQKGLTPSDVAESTHMLVQVVEGLEQEDFRRIAAPIYGRGFVKLYAELLELDPEPLIDDFMNLYGGARAPAVLTKKVEPPDEPAAASAPASAPVTRTVSGPAPRAPQRQPVQPRPAVRPVTVEETPDAGLSTFNAQLSTLNDEEEAAAAQAETDETDGLDLFRPQPPPKLRAGPAQQAEREETGEPFRRKFPIFQIGGRMERKEEAEIHDDEEARARRHARIRAFMDGIAKLKDGVERRLPGSLPRKQVWLAGGVGVLLVVAMIAGVGVLFKLTGSNVKEKPAARFERVAPPPPLYVD